MRMLLLLALIPLYAAQKLTLCEYFNKLGVNRPECRTSSVLSSSPVQYVRQVQQRPRFYDLSHSNAVASTTMFASLPLCLSYFHSCMSSTVCESGTICTSGVDAGSCCTNPLRKMCPSPTDLNIQCRKFRGVNWCNSDFDCHGKSSMPSFCCPTGCNYNMCLNLGFVPIPHLRRHVTALSPMLAFEECPDPYALDIQCSARKHTSWCLTDAECPSVNSIHPRKCCATLCGYNTCLVKYNGRWVVG